MASTPGSTMAEFFSAGIVGLLGWAVGYGTLREKVKTNAKDIVDLKHDMNDKHAELREDIKEMAKDIKAILTRGK